jgi:hypothetical protein
MLVNCLYCQPADRPGAAQMPPTDPTSNVITDQLTRALGEAVIRIWSDLPKRCRIIFSKRLSRHKVNPLDKDRRRRQLPSQGPRAQLGTRHVISFSHKA